MFTGIVTDVGTIRAREPRAGDLRVTIGVHRLDLARVARGDSICVQGVCLTVVDSGADWFAADVSRETLERTTLGSLEPGARINLEPALRAGDPLGGHLVSGHVDGIAEVASLASDARSTRLRVRVSNALARYVASKGSVTLDGVSLTVNDVSGIEFGVNLIPHTLEVTTLGSLRVGQALNLEVDPIARYVERLMGARDA